MKAVAQESGRRRWPPPHLHRSAGIAARTTAAILGGYALASLSAVALAAALPLSPVDSVLTGMMASFLVYTGAAIWAFSTRSAARAWAGIVLAGILLATAVAVARWQATGQVLP